MSIFEKYNVGSGFDFDTPKDFEFKTLKEVYEERGKDPIKLNSLFTHNKSKFGETAVAVTDKELMNLPTHLVDNVKSMITDPEVIETVNKGKAGLEIYEYESAKWGTNYSVRFVELLPF